MDKAPKKVATEILVTGGWAGDETIFKNEGCEYITVPNHELSFACDDDVDEFADIVKEMIKGLS